jgi:hypothetical protein
MLSKDLAKIIGIPATRMSEVLNYKVKLFTVDKLLQMLRQLAEKAPEVKAYVEFLDQAIGMPPMKVTQSHKLTKHLKEVSRSAAI